MYNAGLYLEYKPKIGKENKLTGQKPCVLMNTQ